MATSKPMTIVLPSNLARETKRALIWSAIAPSALILGLFVGPLCFLALGAYPAQGFRLYLKYKRSLGRIAAPAAALTVIGKFAEASGALKYFSGHLIGRRAGLFEYK